MKSIFVAITAFVALTFAATIFAADPSAAQSEAPQLVWTTNYTKALEQAKQEKKIMLLDFTGSDWCAPCIKLKKEVFNAPEFKAFAEKNLVCVEVDFPKRKSLPADITSQNGYLQQKFQVTEFPTVVVLNSDGKLLGTLGYQGGGANAWLRSLNQILSK